MSGKVSSSDFAFVGEAEEVEEASGEEAARSLGASAFRVAFLRTSGGRKIFCL